MDTIQNMKAFLAVARFGSLSAAANELSVVPSVVSKRVSQLERQLQSRLMERSSRRVRLTAVGEQFLSTVRNIVAEYDDLLSSIRHAPSELEGQIRVKAPTALTDLRLSDVFAAFQQTNPRVTLDVVVIDRPVNPIEEGFDLVLGIQLASYERVVEESLIAYPRLLCAAPSYLERRGRPIHPRELEAHDCLVFNPAGSTWSFQTRRGTMNVSIRPKLTSNNVEVVLAAAKAGNGIAILSKFVARPALRSKALEPVLNQFPLVDLWLKAYVPQSRIQLARVQALLAHIRAAVASAPSW
jgi:DNA-binding transcriptional LysR family regulator